MNFCLINKNFLVVEDFLSFIQDKKIIIHNADFDIGHLNNELSLIGKPKISNSNIIDTLELVEINSQVLG